MVNCILTLAPAFQHWSVLGVLGTRPCFPPRPTPPLRTRIGGKGLGPRLYGRPAEEIRQRDVINYSLAHVRERNANLEARSRARVVGQGTKRRC